MRQRNASPHTVAAYRDTFRLLLKFAHARTGKRPSALNLAELDADLIVAFLDHLADDRASSPATYNLRLTAIRAFFRFLAFEEPAYSGQIQRVLAVPGKLSDGPSHRWTRLIRSVEQERCLDDQNEAGVRSRIQTRGRCAA